MKFIYKIQKLKYFFRIETDNNIRKEETQQTEEEKQRKWKNLWF